jgi:hypothetical protein
MALSGLDEKEKLPNDESLRSVLGRTFGCWQDLKTHLASRYGPLTVKWIAGVRYGWTLRLIQKKRTILYMTPSKGFFLVGFVLGERAVQAAHESDLPSTILEVIDGAQKYGEGRGFRLEVRTKQDVENIKKLAAIKMVN